MSPTWWVVELALISLASYLFGEMRGTSWAYRRARQIIREVCAEDETFRD